MNRVPVYVKLVSLQHLMGVQHESMGSLLAVMGLKWNLRLGWKYGNLLRRIEWKSVGIYQQVGVKGHKSNIALFSACAKPRADLKHVSSTANSAYTS